MLTPHMGMEMLMKKINPDVVVAIVHHGETKSMLISPHWECDKSEAELLEMYQRIALQMCEHAKCGYTTIELRDFRTPN